MKSRKAAGQPVTTMVEAVIAIAIGLIILTVLGPPIMNISPSSFLPADLTGGLVKDATPS